MANRELEKNIQSAILDYLALKERQGKLTYWRANNIPPSYVANGQQIYRRPSVHAKKGIPDINVIKEGIFIGLEIKVKGGKQSPAQVEMERIIKKAGGQYYVLSSLGDCISLGL